MLGLFSSGWEGNAVWLSRGLHNWRNNCHLVLAAQHENLRVSAPRASSSHVSKTGQNVVVPEQEGDRMILGVPQPT